MQPREPGRRYLPSPLRHLWRGASSRHADLSSLAGGAESGHTAGHGTNAALETGGQGRSRRGVRRGSILCCCGQGQPSRELHQGTRTCSAPFQRRAVPHSHREPVHYEPTPPPHPLSSPRIQRDALIASLLAAQRAVGDSLSTGALVACCVPCSAQRTIDNHPAQLRALPPGQKCLIATEALHRTSVYFWLLSIL
ncbi:hypothetical protein MRX96_001386 [Rhipicephalus microplus]